MARQSPPASEEFERAVPDRRACKGRTSPAEAAAPVLAATVVVAMPLDVSPKSDQVFCGERTTGLEPATITLAR